MEALLGHTAWARRLAAGIVIDTATADDAVQDAWVAALLHPPRHGRNLRSWLAFLVRNAVRQGVRGESRRRRRERLVARTDCVTAAADAIERAELHRRLVEAVLKLPEPGRSVLVLAYFDELAPAEIARQLGMPPSTVRSHIRRGLQRLRTDLEGEDESGRVLSGLATLAWSRRMSTPISAATVTGGTLMSLKTKLMIAAAVLAFFGAWIWTRMGPGTAPSEVREPTEAALALAEDPRVVPSPIPGSTREEVAKPTVDSEHAQTNVAPGAVLVSVVRELDHSAVAGVGVQILRPGDVQDFETLDGETDERGALRFDGLRPGNARIASDRGSSVEEIEIRSGETKETVLTIPSGTEIRGRVVDLERQPVAGASVWLSWPSGRPRSGSLAARADERGKFVLQDIQEGQLVGARAPGHSPSSLRMVDRTSGAIEVELVLPGKGSVVEGGVFDSTGAPVVGARVEVSELRPHPLRYEGTSFAAFPAAAGLGRSDGSGRFRITDAAAGSCEIVVRAKGFAWARTPLEIPSGGTVQRDIRLSRGASLSGRVLDARGKPVTGTPLWIVPPADPSPRATIALLQEYVGSTDSNGRFRVEALPAERTEFVVESDDLGRASTSIELAEGIEATWEARLSGGSTVSGRVVDAQGVGLARWFVNAQFGKKQHIRDDEVKWLGWRADCRSGSDGRFVLLNCPPEIPLRIGVWSPDKPGRELAWIDDVKAGAEGVEIRVGNDAEPSAFLIGRVLDASSRPLGDAGISAHQSLGGSFVVHARTDAVTGKFRVGPLPPGVYRLTVQANGQSTLETPPEALAQGAEVDLGDVQLPESGTVLVRLQSTDGAPAGEVSLSIYGEGRTPVDLLTITETIARSHRLPVGSYRLVVHENERTTQQISFEVSAEHETQLDVMLSVVPR